MADGVDSLRLNTKMPALSMTGICRVVTISHDTILPMSKTPEAITRSRLCLNMAKLPLDKSAHTHTHTVLYQVSQASSQFAQEK